MPQIQAIRANHTAAEGTDDRLLSIRLVCETTGRGKTWLMEAVRERNFPSPTKISGRLFWSDREVQRWVAGRLAERESMQSRHSDREVVD